MNKFETVFITGAAQGVGLGLARVLAQRGTKLALVDVDTAALDSAVAELSEHTEVVGHRLDVRDRVEYRRVVDTVEASLGPITLLVNNAGVAFPETPQDMTYELWDLALDINLGGVVNGIQTVLPRMIERKGGHIVNTASAAGIVAGVGPAYTASKFAVVGLSDSLRLKLAQDELPIGVTVLCPGGVATNIARSSGALVAAEEGGVELERARNRIEKLVPRIHAAVAQVGADPLVVGRRVVDAVERDRFYVFTDRAAIDLIKERTETLLDHMPTDVEDQRTFADFKGLVRD